MENGVYAGVIIDQVHPMVDRIFHYKVPESMAEQIKIGMRVQVPFGGANKKLEGYVFQLDSSVDIPSEKLKSISRILDSYPAIPENMFPIILWLKEEYHCLTIEAIRCVIPPGLRTNMRKKTRCVVYLNEADNLEEHIDTIEKKSQYMADILRLLAQGDGLFLDQLKAATGAPLSSFKALEKNGLIQIHHQEVYRNPWQYEPDIGKQPKILTEEQEEAISEIHRAISRGYGRILLQGVTGSGKTEVYIHAARKALELNKQVIVLVPEISLTPQTVERFKNHFGQRVAIMHSGLSTGERFDEWHRIQNQQVDIVVGARSAIFVPLQRLGLVIIDEAHEDSYKSDMKPRYHAVDVARKRCELEDAVLLLGSATPSIAQHYMAQNGEYKMIYMKNRIDNNPLPPVEIVDMREEIARGNRSILSGSLYQALLGVLKKGEQAILLLNRRGYAHFVSCRSCGFVLKCGNCDISLTYHAYGKMLKCHYCGQQYSYPSICPKCKSRYIRYFGVGTQRVEEDLKKLLPEARLVRMDTDTTATKGAHRQILEDFREGKYDILLGTQMIAKGLDFPRVTLVGVIVADTALNIPDFRSCEKTFQLITQVAGRAGRGERGGRVIIQTYQPRHYAIRFASKHDYFGFYEEEIRIRRRFCYPPFSHIIRILMLDEEEEQLIKQIKDIENWLRHRIEQNQILKQGLIDIGSYSAPLERINKKYRWQILIRIKTDMLFKQAYHRLLDECLEMFMGVKQTIIADFYPVNLL
ncbi:MAG: primosomal protein N' [Clostridiales bacterium]|nr:primosomal protein N' [Clostridiales bacterium]